MTKGNADNKEEVVAVAIDRDKGSQYALKWTIDHLLARGQTLTLVHVNQRLPSIPKPSEHLLLFLSIYRALFLAGMMMTRKSIVEYFNRLTYCTSCPLLFACFCVSYELLLNAIDFVFFVP